MNKHTFICINLITYDYISTYLYTHSSIRTCKYVHTCTCARTHTYIHSQIYRYAHKWLSTYVCMYFLILFSIQWKSVGGILWSDSCLKKKVCCSNINVYTQICFHTYTHISIHKYTYILMNACTCTPTYCTYICTQVHMPVHTHI